jgi:hypothetical protein
MREQKPSKMTNIVGVRAHPVAIYKERFLLLEL